MGLRHRLEIYRNATGTPPTIAHDSLRGRTEYIEAPGSLTRGRIGARELKPLARRAMRRDNAQAVRQMVIDNAYMETEESER